MYDELMMSLGRIKLMLPITEDKQVLAKAYVDLLHKHDMVFHFEDDVHDIVWSGRQVQPSKECLELMDELRNELYKHADLCGIWVDNYGGDN